MPLCRHQIGGYTFPKDNASRKRLLVVVQAFALVALSTTYMHIFFTAMYYTALIACIYMPNSH